MFIIEGDILIEVVQEIWRSPDATFVVMYPVPEIAYIKGFRGTYTKSLREDIKRILLDKGVKEVHYERLRDGKFHKHVVKG